MRRVLQDTNGLTQRHIQTMRAIANYWTREEIPPTYSDLARLVNSHKSVLHGDITYLCNVGLVKRTRHIARSLRLTPRGRSLLQRHYVEAQ